MLISFSVENWMSFKEQANFSMVASRELQHKERLPKLDKYKIKILPIAAIYGGNASGKTNFFKAINFAKNLIVKGTQPDSLISIEPFRLDAQSGHNPSSFTFELLINEIIYEYSFSLNQKFITQEKLVEINSGSEKILYKRLNNNIEFNKLLSHDQFLQFAFLGTRDNQLFLTNSVSQKVENFKMIYDWFKDTLELVAPDTRFDLFELFIDETHPHYSTNNTMLQQLDTGINRLGGEDIPFDNLPIPDFLKYKLREEVQEGMTVRIRTDPLKELFVVTRKNGELTAKKVITYHQGVNGIEVKFEVRNESDGSQRIIDLNPAFLDLSSNLSKKVYVIDEVDRSLHTLATRRLLEFYLSSCSPETRSQLLFTTHDVLLMDQDLLRRDEMWVTERSAEGISTILSFSEYKDIRYDKDIRKSYLQGRLGGIPRILLGGML